MQDTIWCYLKLVYLQIEWIVEVSKEMKVDDLIELLHHQFSSEPKGMYFYEATTSRLIDGNQTFEQNQIESGNYLYFI